MEIFGYELADIITRQLISFIVTFLVGVILLHIATKILDFEKRSFGKAASTVFIGDIVAFVLGFIPYIGWILGLIGFWYIIKNFYDVSWGKAILAWIMSILVAVIIVIIVLLILGISIIYIPSL